MKRNPGIHITKSKLHKVLSKVLFEDKSANEIKALTDAIMRESVKYAIPKRSLNITNQKLVKSTNGIVNTETEDTNMFAHILTLSRRRLKHRAIVQPRPGTKDWTVIQGIIPNANLFCNDFELDKKVGYLKYIESGLAKMNNFYITNFQSLHESIVNDFAAREELANDMTPLRTEKAHTVYSKYLGEMAIVKDYHKEPGKMVYFKRVAEKASELNISIEHYISAQFEGLKWAKSIPEPQQLVTEAAINRLNKYLVKNDLKSGIEEDKASDIASKIKKKWSQLN